MSDITREQMVEWLKEQPLGTNQDLKISNAIIRLLKRQIAESEEWQDMDRTYTPAEQQLDMREDCSTAQGEPAALDGPEPVTEEERKHLLWRLDWLQRFCGKINIEIGGGRGLFVSGDCCPVCPSGICKEEINQIRLLILGNQGGTVSPDTQVSPHGETGGAVTDKWERDRLWCSALVHVLSVEDVAKVTGYFNSIRPDCEAGVAGKEGR